MTWLACSVEAGSRSMPPSTRRTASTIRLGVYHSEDPFRRPSGTPGSGAWSSSAVPEVCSGPTDLLPGKTTRPIDPNSLSKAAASTPTPTMAESIVGVSARTPGPGSKAIRPRTRQIGCSQSGANHFAEVAARTNNTA